MKRIRRTQVMEKFDLFERGVLITLDTRCWGASAKVDDLTMKGLLKEDKAMLADEIVAVQSLVPDKSKLAYIWHVRDEARRFAQTNSMPSTIRGHMFIPKDMIEYVDHGLADRERRFWMGVDEFLLEYEGLRLKKQIESPDLYDQSKYPDANRMRQRFKFRWTFRMFDVPSSETGLLSPEMYKAEVKKFKQDMVDARDSIISIISKEFLERIDSLRKQCSGDKISTATVDGLNNFLEKFDNVWGGFFAHKQLKSMIKDVKAYMAGTEADMLRYDESFRSMVGKKMAEVGKDFKAAGGARIGRKLDI